MIKLENKQNFFKLIWFIIFYDLYLNSINNNKLMLKPLNTLIPLTKIFYFILSNRGNEFFLIYSYPALMQLINSSEHYFEFRLFNDFRENSLK